MENSFDTVPLRHRGLIEVRGREAGAATAFLQGLVTCNMDGVSLGRPTFGALLTPQGKILVDFIISAVDAQTFLIDCARDQLPALLKRLTLFRLRAPIDLTDVTDRYEMTLREDHAQTNSPTKEAVVVPDPRLPILGVRTYRPFSDGETSPATPPDDDALARYRTLLIDNGVGEIGTVFTPDKHFLLDLNYDRLNGVDYTKGCFVGQEVTSRMKRKGSIRKRTLSVIIDRDADLTGAQIVLDGQSIGSVLAAQRAGKTIRALGLIRIDRLGTDLHAQSAVPVCIRHDEGETPATLQVPAYLLEGKAGDNE
ncbi:MAG: folate-binding protein [Pseudomonadota bacterium]